MTKQAKNARNLKRAAAFSAQRKSGVKGPAQTTPLHGKLASRRAYSTTNRNQLSMRPR